MLLKHRGVLSSSAVRGWERVVLLMSQRCPSTIPRRAVGYSLDHAMPQQDFTQKSAVAHGQPPGAKCVITKHTHGAKALFQNLP